MNPVAIRTAAKGDVGGIADLLRLSGLLDDGVEEFLPYFAVADDAGRIVGVAGLEPYGPDALFRSLAVAPSHRSLGIGENLLTYLTAQARELGATRLLLMTTTAEKYFAHRGFRIIDRHMVTGGIAGSTQFQGACPSTAVCMERTITESGPA